MSTVEAEKPRCITCAHTCERKVGHESEAEAIRALERMRYQLATSGKVSEAFRMRRYRCDFCGKWHLGKSWSNAAPERRPS